ncbi:hypothetical protein [Phreatobacter sp. AB_2022a]|nr:hypothetical protein [Phreatobacter sp. AB_2022a]MCZ0734167.1 hypothetical protein [Phreatobacter sp. AB_2022a]
MMAIRDGSEWLCQVLQRLAIGYVETGAGTVSVAAAATRFGEDP